MVKKWYIIIIEFNLWCILMYISIYLKAQIYHPDKNLHWFFETPPRHREGRRHHSEAMPTYLTEACLTFHWFYMICFNHYRNNKANHLGNTFCCTNRWTKVRLGNTCVKSCKLIYQYKSRANHQINHNHYLYKLKYPPEKVCKTVSTV